MTQTVFEVYYRVSGTGNYKQFKTDKPITDTGAATTIRNTVARIKGTKDVYVSTSKVRTKLDGSTVSESYNYLIKK